MIASVAGDIVLNRVYSLSSLSVSQICRLCLCSVSHPSQFTSLFLTDTQLSISSLSVSLSGGGGLLQTAVGGQDHSRQQEGEVCLGHSKDDCLAHPLLSLSFSIYLPHAHSQESH